MKTAVDSSVLWCIAKGEAGAPEWRNTLQAAADDGSLCVCPVVFAELSSGSPSAEALLGVLRRLGVDYDAILPEAARMAGRIFLDYRRAGGPRTTMIPDFLVAAHACVQCDRLAAIDRGYLRRYFPDLVLLARAGIA